MNKKVLIPILFIIILIVGIFILATNNINQKSQTTEAKDTASTPNTETENYLIAGYPEDKVPLYKVSKVSSSKIFVNTDPKNSSFFGGANYAYFNIVFYTDATQAEFLTYYQNLFDQKFESEFGDPETSARGKIGEYQISASHYDSENTAYLEVYLPSHLDPRLDGYFTDFPELLSADSGLIEHERSYGLLNQKNGELEYTKYYTVIDSGDTDNDGKDDKDEFAILEAKYLEEFGNEPNFAKENDALVWDKAEYKVTLSLSRDHGRIYLMMRKPMG
ncbi:hypothetical protein KBD45_07150 [Candidatus Dojkabacteria bacterium]|nr:hypothetical protein [Candidatus Dojkabacteria bacterium]